MFICRYIGEVITEAEAERRGEEYDRKVCHQPINDSPLKLICITRELHIFSIWTFSEMNTTIVFVWTPCTTVMYRAFSTIHAILMSPFTPFFEVAIDASMILLFLRSEPLNLMKSCALITKLKRALKLDNSATVAKRIARDGYSENR